MAQWITRLTTDQKIAGSNPVRVVFFLFFATHGLNTFNTRAYKEADRKRARVYIANTQLHNNEAL